MIIGISSRGFASDEAAPADPFARKPQTKQVPKNYAGVPAGRSTRGRLRRERHRRQATQGVQEDRVPGALLRQLVARPHHHPGVPLGRVHNARRDLRALHARGAPDGRHQHGSLDVLRLLRLLHLHARARAGNGSVQPQDAERERRGRPARHVSATDSWPSGALVAG
ncbi:hypothetical protein ON010_g3144 [Phytophthora cinnamomi]|nr:hypothetical protein ON010_g3144 [Phytophthora cinnamomi]